MLSSVTVGKFAQENLNYIGDARNKTGRRAWGCKAKCIRK